MSRPLLLGHRGARSWRAIPENTLASFDRALADGCDGFEFDLRLTDDRQAVVCHDPEVGKLQIAHATRDQLCGLPRLEEVLARYRCAFLDIELKVCGLEQIVAEQVKRFELERFVISSFLPEVLSTLHEIDPALSLGLICETEAQLNRWRKLPVQYVIPHHALASQSLIRELHEAERKVLVWTVNRPRDMQQFAAWGVEGIISDETRLMMQSVVL